MDKIFLKFSHPWWAEDVTGFGFLWSEEERKNDNTGWLSGVICFHPINKKSSILRGFILGEAARHMETLPTKELIEGFNYLFEKFLGSTFTISSIQVCLTSKWYQDSHFRGSYSCRLMKTEEADVKARDLAEPVCNVEGLPVGFFYILIPL